MVDDLACLGSDWGCTGRVRTRATTAMRANSGGEGHPGIPSRGRVDWKRGTHGLDDHVAAALLDFGAQHLALGT